MDHGEVVMTAVKFWNYQKNSRDYQGEILIYLNYKNCDQPLELCCH